jgi:hypothetical protein
MDKTKLAEGLFDDLNDAFFMAACNCVDQTTRDLLFELNESVQPNIMSPAGGSLNVTKQAAPPKTKNGLMLNNTAMIFRQQQSQDGIPKDNSFY